MPQAPDVWFRPLLLNTVTGGWCNLLRVRQVGHAARHRHPMAVVGYVIKGRWKYLEHDWIAEEGSFVYEPPGEIHTLTVPDDCAEMITFFNISGAMIYLDAEGGRRLRRRVDEDRHVPAHYAAAVSAPITSSVRPLIAADAGRAWPVSPRIARCSEAIRGRRHRRRAGRVAALGTVDVAQSARAAVSARHARGEPGRRLSGRIRRRILRRARRRRA